MQGQRGEDSCGGVKRVRRGSEGEEGDRVKRVVGALADSIKIWNILESCPRYFGQIIFSFFSQVESFISNAYARRDIPQF